MPCKIQIKENIIQKVTNDSESGYNMSLSDAKKLASDINSEYGTTVVSFFLEGDFVERKILVTNELIDKYYLKEKQIELDEARRQNQEDSERSGEEYSDRYMFQTAPSVKEVFNQSMANKLLEFVKGLNISTQFDADELLADLNFKNKPLAAFDHLQKFLAFTSGQEKLLPSQVANIMYTFLGRKSELSKSLWFNISEWDKYQEVYDFYSKAKNKNSEEDNDYTDEYEMKLDKPNFNSFAHRVAIIKFLEKSLYDSFSGELSTQDKENVDIDSNFFKSKGRMNPRSENILEDLFAKVFNYFLDIFGQPIFEKYDQQKLVDLGLDIAEDVLKGDFKKFIRGVKSEKGVLMREEGTVLELKDYNETINKDAFANSIITKLITHPFINFKVSGSLTLRKFGEVFRPIEEDVHDIDGVITLETFNEDPNAFYFKNWIQTKGLQLSKEDNGKHFMKNFVPLLRDMNWYKNLKQVYPGFVLTNTFIGRDHKKGESVTVTGYVNHPTETEIDLKTGKAVPKKYVLDFFLRIDEGNYPEIFDNYWKDWKQIFEAKLNMGRSKDLLDLVYFSPFISDKFKFTNKGFRFFDFMDNLGQEILTQTKTITSSRANESTLTKVKEIAEKAGIEIKALSDYAKSHPEMTNVSVNGVADLFEGVVAIAQGLEEYTLTEEVVHIATAIIEQTNPELITALISKIGNFKIYKDVFNEYKNLKAYQLSNGNPDIRKIKKEAVDKLLVEILLKKEQGSTQYPELMELEVTNQVKNWWETILGYIRKLYQKAGIELFEDTVDTILEGNFGNINSLKNKNKDVFYQTPNAVRFKGVTDFANKVTGIAERMALIESEDDRHYTLDGERIASSVTQAINKNKKLPERSNVEKFVDGQKRDWGLAGHDFIEKYILSNLLDAEGYKKDTFSEKPIETALESSVEEALITFAKELISSYPAGTKFLLETKVVNEGVSGKLASTIDFMAIEPVVVDGKEDIKVDILDWKFTTVYDSAEETDIPFYKQKDWKLQMGEYSKMLYRYGLSYSNIRKARMIPFIANYSYKVKNKADSGLNFDSVEIGELDSLKETKLYLLPVALDTETTGNVEVDSLVVALRAQWEKLYSKKVDEADRQDKLFELNQLSEAIRWLHMQINFEPLLSVGQTFYDNAKEAELKYSNIDFTKLSKEELTTALRDVTQYMESAEKFINFDKVYLSTIDQHNASAKEKELTKKLEHIASTGYRMLSKFEEIQRQFVIQLGVKENIASADEILKPEKEVSSIAKNFTEGSKLGAKLINLGAKLNMVKRNQGVVEYSRQMDEFTKLILPLEELAAKSGKAAFDYIGTITDTGLRLIKKIDPAFWEEIESAKVENNTEFFLKNMDITKYMELLEETVKVETEKINKRTYTTDVVKNGIRQEFEILKFKNSVDISRKSFNGHRSFKFSQMFSQALIEEGHYSKEYEMLKRQPEALAVWKKFVELNKKGKSLGYLDRQGTSFFPLIEATTIDALKQTDNFYDQVKSMVGDLYKIRVNEKNAFGKLDPETKRVKKVIPKYFTKTDKTPQQLSRDLKKVGSLWINSLINYEISKDLEFTMLTLHSVEKAKGSLVVSDGKVVFDTKGPLSKKDNSNADVFEVLMDDAVYGKNEDLGSAINSSLSVALQKVSKDEEAGDRLELGVKKTFSNANVLVRALAIGLKPLIGVANYVGYNFQAFINNGMMYTYKEFTEANFSIMDRLTTEEKALVHLITPLNENVVSEFHRKLAYEKGIGSWIATWTFSDVMMITNSFGERKLQIANALAFNKNSMVKDDKIVNIRQYLKSIDTKKKYEKKADGTIVLSFSERKALEDSFEKRVKELQESSSILKNVRVTEDSITVEGVTDEELARYRTKIIEYGRNLSGLMNEDNKAGYRRDTIFSSFMMFKGWIPKQLSVRGQDIKRSNELDNWEYGRMRVFAKTLVHIGLFNIKGMRDIISGKEEGLKKISEMYEAKKEAYYRENGVALEITEEEFMELIRTQINNQMKELYVLIGVIAFTSSLMLAEPPEDATDLEKNRYKWYVKGANKISDEISFYYNPLSADSVTRGSILPSLSLLNRVQQFLGAFWNESIGTITGDEEKTKKAYPIKYFLNLVPLGSQTMTEVIPYFWPETAKELGVRVAKESRGR